MEKRFYSGEDFWNKEDDIILGESGFLMIYM